MDMTLLENLMETGLTRHEAQLYLLLSSEGVMSGYEAAKQTGISRSNTYMALAGLTGKGAAVRIEGEVQRYAAVPVKEYCQNKRRHYDQALLDIQEQMPAEKDIAEPFLTIKGREHIHDKMKNLISQTRQRVYLALDPTELQVVLPELIRLCDLGRKVVLITPSPMDLAGVTIYHAVKKPGQIRMIVDSTMVLTGEISAQGESSCLFSRHQALVNLFKESMTNEIQLIAAAATAAPDPKT